MKKIDNLMMKLQVATTKIVDILNDKALPASAGTFILSDLLSSSLALCIKQKIEIIDSLSQEEKTTIESVAMLKSMIKNIKTLKKDLDGQLTEFLITTYGELKITADDVNEYIHKC